MNMDMAMKSEAKSKSRALATDQNAGDHEAAFHFIAFMPIGDELWKLDGLERQPLCLGELSFSPTLFTRLKSHRQNPRRLAGLRAARYRSTNVPV